MKKRLGEILIDAGVLDDLQLRSALAEQRKWGGRLGRILVEHKFIDEETMVFALSRQLGIAAVDLEKMSLPPEVATFLKPEWAEKFNVFPISRDRKAKLLRLATSDPTNFDAEKELSLHTGMHVQFALAGLSAIDRAIRRHYYGDQLEKLATQPEVSVEEAGLLSDEGVLERLLPLEKQLAYQTRALRAVAELLEEKGHLRRGEVDAKLKNRR